jgi:hypothetical protein
MPYDPSEPDVLLSVSSEAEAVAIVTALADYEIQAMSVGGFTSGFKAEAPGEVAVVVKRLDFDRAKRALQEIQENTAHIDWSKVDVTESVEAHTTAANVGLKTTPSVILNRVWWTIELLGVAVCFFIWLFTRVLSPGLIYALTALAVIGIFMALSPFAARRY